MEKTKSTPIKKLQLRRETIRTGLRAGIGPDNSAATDSGMGGGGSGVVQTPDAPPVVVGPLTRPLPPPRASFRALLTTDTTP